MKLHQDKKLLGDMMMVEGKKSFMAGATKMPHRNETTTPRIPTVIPTPHHQLSCITIYTGGLGATPRPRERKALLGTGGGLCGGSVLGPASGAALAPIRPGRLAPSIPGAGRIRLKAKGLPCGIA